MRPSTVLLVAWLASAATAVHAQDAGLSASDWLARAEDAEDRAEPIDALDAWQHVIDVGPTSRLAGRARTRIAWIRARDEAGYGPLRAMMAFLARAPSARDEAAVAAFEATTAAMPAGRVRGESRLAVAGEWARLGEQERAHAAWAAALDDPSVEPSARTLVLESMARSRMDAGDLAGAIDELDAADLGGLSLHDVASRRLRAATWVPVSYGVLATFVLVVLVLVARSRRALAALRSLLAAPLRVVIAAVLAFGPLAIVAWWGDESQGAFEAFAPWSFAIVLLSFLAAESTEARAARAGVGVLAIAAALAAAYVSVARYGEALPFA